MESLKDILVRPLFGVQLCDGAEFTFLAEVAVWARVYRPVEDRCIEGILDASYK